MACGMQWITDVSNARVMWPRFDSAKDNKSRCIDQREQLRTRTQPKMFSEIREQEPALASGLEMRSQAIQKPA